MNTRRCTKCKKTFSFDKFYKDPTKKSGYSSWCRECISKRNEENKGKKERTTRDYYKQKYEGYKRRTERKYPFRLNSKYYLKEGEYYIYRESFESTRDEEIIIKVLKVTNKPDSNTCNISFKQIYPSNGIVTEWSFPLSSLRQKWKFEKISKEDVIRRVGKQYVD